MTVPFRNAADLEAGGTAAFLRIVAGRSKRERAGAILQVNGRGDPIEFTFNQMELPAATLWRAGDLDRHATRTLATSLFSATQRSPLLLLCLAREVGPEMFRQELQVQLPVCRVASADDIAALDPGEIEEEAAAPEQAVHLFWTPAPPPPESPPRRLIQALAARGLLLEPFERIPRGILEALAEEAER